MRYALNHCHRIDKDGTSRFTGPCVVTGELQTVVVSREGIGRYLEGAKIQDAFPELSEDAREFLQSGMSIEGWNRTFPEEEE